MALAALSLGVIATGQPGLIHPFDASAAAGWSVGGGYAQTSELLIDGSPDAVAAVKAGEMQYTVLQPVAVFSAEAIKEADKLLQKQKLEQREKELNKLMKENERLKKEMEGIIHRERHQHRHTPQRPSHQPPRRPPPPPTALQSHLRRLLVWRRKAHHKLCARHLCHSVVPASAR